MTLAPATVTAPAARLEGWEGRFHALLAAHRTAPFAWGTVDCAQLARRDVEALTGADPAAGWGLRPYRTSQGAAAQLARLGGLAALPARAGCAEVRPLFAGRGDLALVPNDGRPALGVVTGPAVAFAGKHGLVFVPLSACPRAWRVGRPAGGPR